jgi:DNA repair protein RecO (recombination protein O)
VNPRTPLKAEAFVLRTLDYGDSDRIVTFLTDDFGKVRGIAKGARKSRKRFANALEPFSRVRILFSRRSRDSLALIESSDPVDHHEALRGDLEKTLLASCVVDLADHFSVEGKKNDPLYALVRDFLHLLDREPALTEDHLRFFEIRLLKVSGFDPVLDRCTACRCEAENGVWRFDPRQGGIRCGACGTENPDAVTVSAGTLKTLLLGKEADLDRIGRIAFTRQAAEEGRTLLARFIRHLLGREIKSLQVLRAVRRLEG